MQPAAILTTRLRRATFAAHECSTAGLLPISVRQPTQSGAFAARTDDAKLDRTETNASSIAKGSTYHQAIHESRDIAMHRFDTISKSLSATLAPVVRSAPPRPRMRHRRPQPTIPPSSASRPSAPNRSPTTPAAAHRRRRARRHRAAAPSTSWMPKGEQWRNPWDGGFVAMNVFLQ